MNYQQTIQYLFSQLPMYQRVGKAAYKANLNNTIALDKYFNHPHQLFKTIHVAGTNGKGSVSHMLASVLMEAGYKVGLYTSPHLKDFRERIRINGIVIPEKNVIEFVENHKNIFESLKPSFFEMTVAMAFHYFAEERVEIAVIEVGLGGRLDSTNIIVPELSIITNIGLDHTDLLGNSLKSIAIEKAGIIKANVPILIGETQEEVKDVFVERANELKTPIFFADSEYRVISDKISENGLQYFTVEGNNSMGLDSLCVDLLGLYQSKNLPVVLAAIDLLRSREFSVTQNDIQEGLKNVVRNTTLMGRWQIIDHSPLIVCDTGHNAEGIKQIVNQLLTTPHNLLHIVFGVVGDKDAGAILSLLPKNANYFFTKASIPRALNENQLYSLALEHGLHGKTYPNVPEALRAAREQAAKNDLIFIGGSTFVVADII